MKHARTWTALLALTAGFLSGCQTAPEPAPTPPATQSAVPDARGAATAMLVDHTRAFNQIVVQMPGGSGAAHRQLLVGALGELSTAIQLANGSTQSPEFANRIAVIDASAKTASIPSIPRARMEAVENEAIRAAYKALNEIASRYLFGDDQLPPMLDAVDKNTDVTVASMGPIHDQESTETFRAIQSVLQRITDDMVERFGTVSAGDTTTVLPAATPAAPAIAPATMP